MEVNRYDDQGRPYVENGAVLDGDSRVNGQMRVADEALVDLYRCSWGGELTISSGEITVTNSRHTVDTEGDAASDDLDTINGAVAGAFVFLQAEHGARTIVLKDGTGNLKLAGDFSMNTTNDVIMLFTGGGNWWEVSRSNNA